MAEITDKIAVFDDDFHNLVNRTVGDVMEFYLSGDGPIVCGISGKDSEVMLQMLLRAMLKLDREQLSRKVYVINVDTLVEPPVVKEFFDRKLESIRTGTKALGLPVEVVRLNPDISDSFWVNVIGRGYPAPSINFRWCTDRLKIAPVSNFIKSHVDMTGCVVVCVGTRKAESTARKRSLAKHDAGVGGHLKTNKTVPGSYLYAGIEDWSTDDVWKYLATYPSAYGGHNHDLVRLYKEASDSGECPLVLDKSAPT